MQLKARSLYQLYPDVKTIEGKALKFLMQYASYGNSQRAMGRDVGLAPTTVASIYTELKDQEIFIVFQAQLKTETKGFEDLRFKHTIFARYEAEITRLEDLITNTPDTHLKNQLIRTKHSMLRDQLRTVILLQTTKGPEKQPEESAAVRRALEAADKLDKDPKDAWVQ